MAGGVLGAVKSAVLCWFPTLEKLLCLPQLVLQSCCALQARFWSCWLLAEPMYTTEPVRQHSWISGSRHGDLLSNQSPCCPWEPRDEVSFCICTTEMEKRADFPSFSHLFTSYRHETPSANGIYSSGPWQSSGTFPLNEAFVLISRAITIVWLQPRLRSMLITRRRTEP